MKHRSLWISAALLALAGGGVAWWAGGGSAPAPAPSLGAIVWQSGPPTSVSSDAEAIFKKAMWRRPGPDDKILHAERHEWSDGEGVNRWQWFLIVEASPDLITYLREDNAFGLVPGSVEPIREAPAWFSFQPDEVAVLKSPMGGMRLMFAKKASTIYATSSGAGFTKGAPEPVTDFIAPASTRPPASGRLPLTMPPNPSPQSR
jgi:hypothetical protein